MPSSPTVAYFYDPDVGNFHYGKVLMFKIREAGEMLSQIVLLYRIQVPETCNRTDYLSKDRLPVLLQIYRSVNDRLKLSELNVCRKNCINRDFHIQMKC